MGHTPETAMEFEEMPFTKKKAKTSKVLAQPKTSKTTKKDKVKNMDKNTFKKAKQAHKVEIAKLKAQRAKLKNDIKRHKMLIKQAKLVYKISKMKESK